MTIHNKKCPHCNETKDISEFYSCKSRKIVSWCKTCFNTYTKRRWKERKLQVIKIMGGKCQLCNYNKCINALDLHHIDPSTKKYDWNKLKLISWSKVIQEIQKCILLCANCHRELHSLKEDDLVLSGKDNPILNRQEPKPTGKCPQCKTDVFNTKYCSAVCVHLANRRVDRPTKQELEFLIQTESFCAIARKFKVSDTAIRKWAKFYNIPLNNQKA